MEDHMNMNSIVDLDLISYTDVCYDETPSNGCHDEVPTDGFQDSMDISTC